MNPDGPSPRKPSPCALRRLTSSASTFPIFGFSHCRDVVAAVTNAGGCGVLGAVAHSPEQLDIDLTLDRAGGEGQAVRRRPARAREVRGRRRGRPRSRASSASCCPRSTGSSSTSCSPATTCRPLPDDDASVAASAACAIDPKSMAPLLDVLFAHKHAPRGVRARAAAAALHRARPRAPASPSPRSPARSSTRDATRSAGADLIVAQGTEAGGHTGMIATMVLVPEVVDAVAPVPVLAAGGIARGRQLAAGMALGADGVWCGSVWLTTEEAETPPAVKEKFLARGPRRHRAVAVDDGQAGPRCCAPRGPTSGSAPTGPAAADADPADAHRRRACGASTVSPPRKARARTSSPRTSSARSSARMNTVQPTRRVVLEMVEEFIDTVQRLDTLVNQDAGMKVARRRRTLRRPRPLLRLAPELFGPDGIGNGARDRRRRRRRRAWSRRPDWRSRTARSVPSHVEED